MEAQVYLDERNSDIREIRYCCRAVDENSKEYFIVASGKRDSGGGLASLFSDFEKQVSEKFQDKPALKEVVLRAHADFIKI